MSDLRTGRRPPVPPPRLNGDYESDNRTLQLWMKDFYQSIVTESGIGDPSYQFAPATINEADPPSPGQTTIAQAQATANLALSIVRTQRERIDTLEGRIDALESQAAQQQAAIDDLETRVTTLEP